MTFARVLIWLARQQRLLYAGLWLVALVAFTLPFWASAVLRQLFERLSLGLIDERLFIAVVAFASLLLVRAAVVAVMSIGFAEFVSSSSLTMRRRLIDSLMTQDGGTVPSRGVLVQRLRDDVANLCLVLSTLPAAAARTLLCLVAIGGLLWIDWTVGLVAGTAFLMTAFGLRALKERIEQAIKTQRAISGIMENALERLLASVAELKVLGSGTYVRRYGTIVDDRAAASIKQAWLERVAFVLARDSVQVFIGAVLLIVALGTDRSASMVGVLAMSIFLAGLVGQTALGLSGTMAVYRHARVSWMHLQPLLSEERVLGKSAVVEVKEPWIFEARDIMIGSNHAKTIAVPNIALQAGHWVALRGPTGSGKTLVLKALLGEAPIANGDLTWNGQSVDAAQLRRIAGVAYVPQQPILLPGTLRENIDLGRSISMSRVSALLWLSALDEDVSRLPAGEETPISERALELSGGQTKRVALARALAGNPRILILDEFTSGLDEATANIVWSRLRAGYAGGILFATSGEKYPSHATVITLQRE